MKSIVRRIAGSFALPLAAFLLLTSLPGTAQTFSNLHSFTYNPDGGNPYAGLIMDAAGNLYGTTAQGGTGNGGTVFELVNSSGSYSEIILHRFNNPSFFGRQRWELSRPNLPTERRATSTEPPGRAAPPVMARSLS